MVKTASAIYRDNVYPNSVSVGGVLLIEDERYNMDRSSLSSGLDNWKTFPGEEVIAIHSRDLFFWGEEGD